MKDIYLPLCFLHLFIQSNIFLAFLDEVVGNIQFLIREALWRALGVIFGIACERSFFGTLTLTPRSNL